MPAIGTNLSRALPAQLLARPPIQVWYRRCKLSIAPSRARPVRRISKQSMSRMSALRRFDKLEGTAPTMCLVSMSSLVIGRSAQEDAGKGMG